MLQGLIVLQISLIHIIHQNGRIPKNDSHHDRAADWYQNGQEDLSENGDFKNLTYIYRLRWHWGDVTTEA